MGRFASAKANGETPTILQRALNYLIDLLDQGYSTSLTLGGKTIVITINPKDGIAITVNAIKVFGINSDGRIYAQSIGTPANTQVYAVIGQTTNGYGIELWDENLSVVKPFLAIRETVAGGVEFYDSSDRLRFKLGDTGYAYLADENNYVRYAHYTDGKTEIYSGGPGQNKMGVDATGVYKQLSGGAKTYL